MLTLYKVINNDTPNNVICMLTWTTIKIDEQSLAKFERTLFQQMFDSKNN